MFLSEETDVKQEICWFYPNVGLMGDQVKAMQLYLHYDIINAYVGLLEETSAMLLEEVLKCLNKLLLISNKNLADGQNVLLLKFAEYGGPEKLMKLQDHKSDSVYKMTTYIIKKFFVTE